MVTDITGKNNEEVQNIQRKIEDIQKEIEDNQKKLKEMGISEGAISGSSALHDALGSDNSGLYWHLVGKTMPIVSTSESKGHNLILEAINSENPKDAVEARLIMQANASYSQGMEMLRKAGNTQRVDFMREYGNLAVKLLRVHNETIETLNRHRRGGEQKVTVVHVADKMAVVNNYGEGRGMQENQGGSPCSSKNAEQRQEPTTMNHVASQQWPMEGADFMEVKAPAQGQKKDVSV
jgi:hypothetical protein